MSDKPRRTGGTPARRLNDQLPHYRTALTVYTVAVTEQAQAQTGRDRATDRLEDARARAQAEGHTDQLPREARTAALHLQTLPDLGHYRTARDKHTTASAELERTRALERGEREILRSLRALVEIGADAL